MIFGYLRAEDGLKLGLLLGRQLDDFNGIISIDINDNLAPECHFNVDSNCSSQFIGQFTARVGD